MNSTARRVPFTTGLPVSTAASRLIRSCQTNGDHLAMSIASTKHVPVERTPLYDRVYQVEVIRYVQAVVAHFAGGE